MSIWFSKNLPNLPYSHSIEAICIYFPTNFNYLFFLHLEFSVDKMKAEMTQNNRTTRLS